MPKHPDKKQTKNMAPTCKPSLSKSTPAGVEAMRFAPRNYFGTFAFAINEIGIDNCASSAQLDAAVQLRLLRHRDRLTTPLGCQST
jgi:hypothetical protein